MTDLPDGTVTFLLTDVEGSTALWEQAPEAMHAALSRHDFLFEEASPTRWTTRRAPPDGNGRGVDESVVLCATLAEQTNRSARWSPCEPQADPGTSSWLAPGWRGRRWQGISARPGSETLLIERARLPAYIPRQGSFERPTEERWAEIGVMPQIEATGTPTRRGYYTATEDAIAAYRFPVGDPVGYSRMVRRLTLDEILAKHAGSLPTVELRMGVSASDVLWDGDRVVGLRLAGTAAPTRSAPGWWSARTGATPGSRGRSRRPSTSASPRPRRTSSPTTPAPT